MKNKTKIYFRSLYIAFIIICCLCFGFIGIAKSYENTVSVAYGQYRPAIEITSDGIRILDFIIK